WSSSERLDIKPALTANLQWCSMYCILTEPLADHRRLATDYAGSNFPKSAQVAPRVRAMSRLHSLHRQLASSKAIRSRHTTGERTPKPDQRQTAAQREYTPRLTPVAVP